MIVAKTKDRANHTKGRFKDFHSSEAVRRMEAGGQAMPFAKSRGTRRARAASLRS